MHVKAIAFGANLFQSRIEKALFHKVFLGTLQDQNSSWAPSFFKNPIGILGSESFFASLRRLLWQTWHLRPCLCRPFRFALFGGAIACQSHCFWRQFIPKPDRKGFVSKGFFWAPSKIRKPVGHLFLAKRNLASRLHLGIYL